MEKVADIHADIELHCAVCGRRNSWGCGHSGSQRWAARRHQATIKHQVGACDCRDSFGRKHRADGTLLP